MIASLNYQKGYDYNNGFGSTCHHQQKETPGNGSGRNINRSQSKSNKALEAANMKKGLEKKIEEGNIGYEMLVKMGYQVGQGLGKDGNGILHPLPLEKKSDRKGLGAPKPSVATPSAKANDQPENTKRRSRRSRKRANKGKATKEVEQQARMARDQANVAQKAADKAKELAAKAQKAADEIKVATAAAPVVETKTKIRKHSPIRAPTPPSSAAHAANETFSGYLFADHASSDSNYLKSLLKRFYSEIELMQLRLEAAASSNPKFYDNDLILAKIRVGNNELIAEHAFDFIRTELVGWIGMYQEQDMQTPIFHAMTNNQRHITVVCDNGYAFQCLEHCIKGIAKIKTMNGIRVLRLPPITPLIYCVDAVYEGVSRDPDLFLQQIHLHKPKLLTDCWIVVSHEVCTNQRRTCMIFLIDERSALALNFQYSSNFCICMQMVTFRNRGVVAERYLN